MLDSGVTMLRQIYAKLLPTRFSLPHDDDDDDDHPDGDGDDNYHTLGHMPSVGFMQSHYILGFHCPDNDDNSRNNHNNDDDDDSCYNGINRYMLVQIQTTKYQVLNKLK